MSNKFRIGFVDENLDNFHANTYLGHIRRELADRNFQVTGCTALEAQAGKKWAKDNNVSYFDSVGAMDSQVDGYMVLAPSSPQVHLQLCQAVLPCGKPTYVDKTFAPDSATAKKIFDLADQHHTAVQTSSALRYTNIQEKVAAIGAIDKIQHMVCWGSGSSFGEYGIHPVELAVSSMGPQAKKLRRRGQDKYSQLLIDFEGGRTATINVYLNQTPYAASITTEEKTELLTVDAPIFLNMTGAIMDLLESGKPNIDRQQTMTIMRILDAAKKPEALETFIDI